MEITIKRVYNGYIVFNFEDEKKETVVIEDTESEVKTLRNLFYELQTALGNYSSKHGAECLYHVIAPGYSHENYTEAHDRVIYPEDHEEEK